VLQWKAGGLNQAKTGELHKTLEDEEIHVLFILEASVREGNMIL
jgi:hypothetical protein